MDDLNALLIRCIWVRVVRRGHACGTFTMLRCFTPGEVYTSKLDILYDNTHVSHLVEYHASPQSTAQPFMP